MDRLEALRRSSLMRAFDERQLQSLASVAKDRTFEPGEYLLREGTTAGLAMYVVLEGRVEVRSGGVGLAELGPGAHVGEMAVLAGDETPRSADVVAIEPTKAMQITRWDLLPFIESNPKIALALIEELARRLQAADETIAGRD